MGWISYERMKQMEYTVISGTEINVSRIGPGTWAIGGWMWGCTDERESINTIHASLDKGINLIETAPVYGFGVSEETVGKAIEERGHREKVFIATRNSRGQGARPARPRGRLAAAWAAESAGAVGAAGAAGAAGKEGWPDSDVLLAWYDRHRRTLPWRAPPGEAADPYLVWLSEIMLQQTTVTAAAPYFLRFVARFPTLASLAKADGEDVLKLWAGLGYYARGRNLHACARMVAARGGFPDREDQLMALPGIGPYTAAAVAAIAFGRKATPVDGNIERVVARLFAVEIALPPGKPMIRRLAGQLTPAQRPGDFAQAMMDLGATLCTPKAPACALCPLSPTCAARRRGDPENFPRRTKKRAGGLRRGAAFVAIRADGHVLVRRRPGKGLLGGMTEVPTSEWRTGAQFDEARALAEAPALAAPLAAAHRGGAIAAQWRRIAGMVTHRFTHFPLELVVFAARLPRSVRAPDGMRFIAPDELAVAALPSLMRKVLAHAGADLSAPRPAHRQVPTFLAKQNSRVSRSLPHYALCRAPYRLSSDPENGP
jgi:A/G-specific adenine glycosylase